MDRKIVLTEDGSHTVQLNDSKEHYHSTFGAIQESMHIFINHGFKHLSPAIDNIQIFEVGFGTGLNAFLTYLQTSDKDIFVNYTAIEAFPLDKEIYSELNYHKLIKSGEGEQIFALMHDAPWNQIFFISPKFALTKVQTKIENFDLRNKYHIIYFDAFDPEYQPELWTESIFNKMYKMLEPGGIIITYCAKGKVKRAMKSAGFKIEELPGPPGKREITRGYKL